MEISLKKPILFATIIVAACSILYELLLAQALSTTMGNTILRYNITVGLYMASLGIGAILYSKFNIKDYVKKLIDIEVSLSIIGAVFPISILVFEYIMQKIASDSIPYSGSFIQSLIYSFNHLLIAVIGLLSGFELPLLMEIGEKIEKKLDMKVLIVDYLGTLIGIALFPIFLLPYIGIFSIALMVAFLNSIVATLFALKFSDCQKRKVISTTITSLLLICLIFHQQINELVIDGLYLK